jgi:predicted enzyme related to lactoylglutathione lyase
MRPENKIDYIEIPTVDIEKAKVFFGAMMGWHFEDWGPDYASFSDGRLDGGFRRSEVPAPATGVLVVFFSEDLERDRDRVVGLGGSISQEIFEFPGGRRFHFVDTTGNEYAIWAEPKNEQ